MLDKFEQLRNKYTGSFGQKQTDIQSAWDKKNIKEIESLLHKLAGSSGSYEFHQLSQLCRQTLECINNSFEVDDSVQFEGCLDELFTEMIKNAE